MRRLGHANMYMLATRDTAPTIMIIAPHIKHYTSSLIDTRN